MPEHTRMRGQILRLLLRHKAALAVCTLAGLLGGAATVGLVALIGELAGHPAQAPGRIAPLAGLLLVSVAAGTLSGAALIRMSQQLIFEVRMLLCERITGAPLRQIEELGAPRLLALLTDDLKSIANGIMNLPLLLTNGAVLLGCIAFLIFTSPGLSLLALGFGAIGTLVFLRLVRRAGESLERARTLEEILLGHYRAMIDGAKELLLHQGRREGLFRDGLEPVSRDSQRSNSDGLMRYVLAQSWSQALFFATLALVILIAPRLGAAAGEEQAAVIQSFVLTLTYAMMPLSALTGLAPAFGRALVAVRTLEAVEIQAEAGRAAAGEGGGASWQSIEMRAVEYAYPAQADGFRLGPIDLQLRPGEIVFVIGGNGSGKSTLARLLTGLYPPSAGTLLLNGVGVGESSRQSYRELFGAVFSDFWLFDRPLGWQEEGVRSRAEGFLRTLGLDDKLTLEEGRFSTTALSAGQRRRLALVAALSDDRPLYLFDEWAADQDPAFKEFFYRELLPGLRERGKTVVVISHDDRYFDVADRTFKLEAGRLLESGAQEGRPPHRPAREARS